MLDEAREHVRQMWIAVRDGPTKRIFRADANDTVHFIHEEVGEVVKVLMQLGMLGAHDYVRSSAVESHEYTLADLIMEVGDVLLMALTLAQSLDLDPTVCLAESLNKFYRRAGLGDRVFEGLYEVCGPPETMVEGNPLQAARECPGFVANPDSPTYCIRCGASVYSHTYAQQIGPIVKGERCTCGYAAAGPGTPGGHAQDCQEIA